MGKLQNSWEHGISRRNAVRGLASFAAGAALLQGQQDEFRDHSRVPGMEELSNSFDFESVAFAKLPRQVFNYTAYGSGGEFTLRRNRAAFDWVDLVPNAVANVGAINTSTEICGTQMDFPIMVSPTAAHITLHPDAEAATHQGCTAAAGTPMIVSQNASLQLDKIAEAAEGTLWFQLYPRQGLEANRAPLENAQQSGYKAVVVTVDQQAAYYERTLHDRYLRDAPRGGGGRRRAGGRRPAPANPYRVPAFRLFYEWGMFAELRTIVKVPMLAKGILTAEDARLCVEHGLDGIIVSNHGGRTLDHVASSLEVLPEIVDAVAGRIPVIIDSGFRRGSDVLKALGLGASAVSLGRVPRWGLGAFGAPGVQRVLEIIQGELVMAMAQTGRPNLASIDSTLVRTNFV